jgi:nucleoside 2-deoxyribosyltransferase-like protein
MPRKRSRSRQGFVQIEGRWKFEESRALFTAPTDAVNPVGLCLLPSLFRSGTISVDVRFIDTAEGKNGRIVIGYNPATGGYISVGLGGYGFAYVIDMFTPGQGWRALARKGADSQILGGRSYRLRVDVVGQQISLSVDDVQVIETNIPSPLEGGQCGIFAWGTSGVEFTDFHVDGDKAKIFVVMQFGPPYDDLYREVIERISDKLDLTVLRGDDVFRAEGNSIILQDIIRSIKESDIIVAEITPANPNVFYELGYAHAMNKPTILLANRGVEKLPFDVSGYRVIFYDDTIRGKRDIEESLQRHLENVIRGFGAPLRERGAPIAAQ